MKQKFFTPLILVFLFFSLSTSAQTIPTNYVSRVFAEDYTGAWCGYCPRIAYKFDYYMAVYPHFISIGNHYGTKTAIDTLTTSYQKALDNQFNIQGFPTAWMMRAAEFQEDGKVDYNDSNKMTEYFKPSQPLGLAINSLVNGVTLSGNVKVGFGNTFTENLKLVIELVQDSIQYDQTSYYNNTKNNPLYHLGDPIPNFEQRNVLRKFSTDLFGDAVPTANTVAGSEYSLDYSFDISGYNAAHCKVVAYVVYADGQTKKGAINVQWVNAGSNIDYENANALPLNFVSFNGNIINSTGALNWTTVNEKNNKGFDVEKSNDGQTFSSVGFVKGQNLLSGNDNYSFSDAKLVSGDNYYRLKQIDLDGNYKYSSVIKLSFAKFDWSVLGNASNNVWMQLQLDKAYNISVQIISLSGNVMQSVNKGNIGKGTYSIPLDLSHAPSGIYIVKLNADGQHYSKKIIK